MEITNLYRRWIDMKSRCYNKNNCNYKYYGGRGIKVCDEWVYNFKNIDNKLDNQLNDLKKYKNKYDMELRYETRK